jgi:hypothetical protein
MQVFHGLMHEGALLLPNITIIWDGRICMFAFRYGFALSFVCEVYIGLLSRMRADLTLQNPQLVPKICLKIF